MADVDRIEPQESKDFEELADETIEGVTGGGVIATGDPWPDPALASTEDDLAEKIANLRAGSGFHAL